MTVSIIIPTCNEAERIGTLVSFLLTNSNETLVDIIVSDGGSEDKTSEVAKKAGANVVISPKKGRGAQMNYGAGVARGDLLYFIHADCIPPVSYLQEIQKAVNDGYDLGRYRTSFNSDKKILKINAWFTRFDLFICMGGDQTLFIRKTLFDQFNGFNEDMQIMEEFDLCARVRRHAKYKILKGVALISARKYDTNSWLHVQLANAKVVRMYRKGASQKEMMDTYQRMLNYRKYSLGK